jgi:hypothetical protein
MGGSGAGRSGGAGTRAAHAETALARPVGQSNAGSDLARCESTGSRSGISNGPGQPGNGRGTGGVAKVCVDAMGNATPDVESVAEVLTAAIGSANPGGHGGAQVFGCWCGWWTAVAQETLAPPTAASRLSVTAAVSAFAAESLIVKLTRDQSGERNYGRRRKTESQTTSAG